MFSLTADAFYDDTVGDKQLAYRYLDQVQKDVGLAMYDSTSELLVMQLALTLGNLDKDRLTSAGFIQHVRQVEKLKDRFYTKRKLTGDEIASKIRHEDCAGEKQ
jgi:NADPH:quinone reductase-like Zn-dependent oxidoreductase